jgi:hypothetical protein
MVIGSADDMRASILFHTIRSFKRQQDTSVIIFAYKKDEIYRRYQAQPDELLKEGVSVITDFEAMCGQLEQIKTLLNPDNEKRILLCWLGLEEITYEFSEKPAKIKDSNVSAVSLSNSLSDVALKPNDRDAMINKFKLNMSDGNPGAKPAITTAPTPDAPPQLLYNANPDIQELFVKGSRRNLFSFVTFSSVTMIGQTKLENFEHKIALRMTTDESAAYLGFGRKASASGLDDNSAVYADGSGAIRTFSPYIL